jgi:hypothetical protein
MTSTGKADTLKSYYASLFFCNHNIPKTQIANSGETLIINAKIIRKRLAKIWRNKSVDADEVPGELLNFGQIWAVWVMADLGHMIFCHKTSKRAVERAGTLMQIH